MIVLDNPLPELGIDPHSLEMLGIGLVSINEKTYNIIFRKGITHSILKTIIRLYKNKIIQKQEGKLIELLGTYTVYIHFFKVEREIITIFYINEKNNLIKYDDLCLLSNKILKVFSANVPISKINTICNNIVPPISGISAMFIIGTAGHSYFKKINEDQKFLSENYIQIGGFISAITAFSQEVICKQSGENLKAINFDNQQFYMNVKEDVIFAFLINNKVEDRNLKRYIELIAEEFLDLHRERICKFNGDLGPFNEFGAIVDKYFII